MDLDLKNKVAIVVGVGSIGGAIALTLGKEGAKVMAHHYCCDKEAKKVEQALVAQGESCITFKADITKEAQVDDMFKQAIKTYGKVDILVHAAGAWPTHSVEEMELKDLESCMAINMNGVFLTNRWLVRHLLERDAQGSILNFTSQAAFRGATTNHAHYAASKAAVVAFSISLAREVATKGILVNCIAPGIAFSEMIIPHQGADPQRESYYQSRIPLGRIADPQEIANIAVFAVSPKNSYMTGATLDLSGGILMR